MRPTSRRPLPAVQATLQSKVYAVSRRWNKAFYQPNRAEHSHVRHAERLLSGRLTVSLQLALGKSGESVVTRLQKLLGFWALCMPLPVGATCTVNKLAELPVTMSGYAPIVTAKLNGMDARFILDSGAGYSAVSRATARDFGLRIEALPGWFRLRGIGGDASADLATAQEFILAGIRVPHAEFIAGGSDTGMQGLIGQNILGMRDIEYDLPHSMVRLMSAQGCHNVNLAYWAGDKPVTMLPLIAHETSGAFKPHTIAIVTLNGKKLRAVFDSGAGTSLLSLAAAKGLGVTPTSLGVVPAGFARGLGTREPTAWIATFDKIDIGGEAIPHPKFRMSELDISNADMLIGADFFMSHRIFVSNAEKVMYVTYEGGPLFGLSPVGAIANDGKRIDLTQTAPDPKDAESYSRRGALFLSSDKADQAVASFDRAIALSPLEGRYFRQRAAAHLARREGALALGDIDQAIKLSPTDPEARLLRARLYLQMKNMGGAVDDVRAADVALPLGAEQRLGVGGLYDALGHPEAALINYEAWLKSHPEDSSRAVALNGRCWARGQLNRELDKALSDCNAALKLRPSAAAYLDSRALVRLRRGELELAIKDYNEAVKGAPTSAWSIYARSIAEHRAGQFAQETADRSAALALDPEVAKRAKAIGLEN